MLDDEGERVKDVDGKPGHRLTEEGIRQSQSIGTAWTKILANCYTAVPLMRWKRLGERFLWN